jgi:transposase-like protein
MSDTPISSDRGRFSAPRKAATVLRLFRGESLELLARELGVTAATLSGWRDDLLAGGQAALKCRPADERDDEIARLWA